MTGPGESPKRCGAQLDWLNFFLADVRGGLGPYVGVFLLTQAHWDQATLGAVLTVSGLIGIALHAPIGALIDATRFKRGLLVAGVAALTASALAIAWAPTVPVVLAADIVMAVLGAVFAPTVAAITLGLVGRTGLAERLGRNAACDRAGNIFIGALAGLVGWAFGQRAVFHLVPFFAVLTTLTVLAIPASAIDHEQARGLDEDRPGDGGRPAGWRVLLERRPLLVLAAGVALFHFANAPMLPLLTQKLALAHAGAETALVAACVVTAQLVSVPTALLVGARADSWGRKPLLLAAFAALPLRGVLYTVSDDPAFLIAVQALDGIGLGILDALHRVGAGRYHARDRALQRGPRGRGHRSGHRRLAEQCRGGRDRRQRRLRRGLPDARSRRAHRVRRHADGDAGDGREGGGAGVIQSLSCYADFSIGSPSLTRARRTNSRLPNAMQQKYWDPRPVRASIEDHPTDLARTQLLRLGGEAEKRIDFPFGERRHEVAGRVAHPVDVRVRVEADIRSDAGKKQVPARTERLGDSDPLTLQVADGPDGIVRKQLVASDMHPRQRGDRLAGIDVRNDPCGGLQIEVNFAARDRVDRCARVWRYRSSPGHLAGLKAGSRSPRAGNA